jgi:hypothetical protein
MRLSFVLPILAIFSVGLAGELEYGGPKSLGPYDINRELSAHIFSQYLGSPIPARGAYSCYEAEDGHSFSWIVTMAHQPGLIGGVLISDFPNCLGLSRKKTSTNFSMWKTEKGIGLGSTADMLKESYGKPSRQSKVEGTAFRWVVRCSNSKNVNQQIGEIVFVYRGTHDDLRTAMFGLRKNRVAWIFLSTNE